jgi:hypothetical protein
MQSITDGDLETTFEKKFMPDVKMKPQTVGQLIIYLQKLLTTKVVTIHTPLITASDDE